MRKIVTSDGRRVPRIYYGAADMALVADTMRCPKGDICRNPVLLPAWSLIPARSSPNLQQKSEPITLTFEPIALTDTQSASPPSHFQETASAGWEMAYLSSHAQATPLADPEAAHLPHESSRDPSRPPSYVEEDMAEPLPTYVDAIRLKMKQAMPYPNNGMPSKPVRFWLSVILAIVLLGVIAIPVAVARNKIDSSNPER